MIRDVTLIAISIIVALTGCKSDKCEDLPAQAQIDVVFEGKLTGDVDHSEVVLTINDENEVSHSFAKAAPSFVFAFEEYNQPPRSLDIVVTVFDRDGQVLGSGQLSTTFSADSCNFFTVTVMPGGALDAGPDGEESDAGVSEGPPDGPAVEGPPPDTSFQDSTLHDMALPDVAQFDAPPSDVLQPDSGPIVPGLWIALPPQGTPMPVTFSMGSPTNENCRHPNETLHQVTLTHRFEMSAFEVSQGDFQALMSNNPSSFPSCGADCPVEETNWYEAAAYCNALSVQAGLTQCYSCSGTGSLVTCDVASAFDGTIKSIFDCPGFRLPTEAEWEFAYRAGSSTALYPSAGSSGSISNCYTSDPNADKIAWHRYNSAVTYAGCYDLSSVGGDACSGTHPRGQKAPNAWGLFDMAGNVWEWCHDWYQSDLGSTAITDPWGPSSGSYRALRGGAWIHSPHDLRAARHYYDDPSVQQSFFGFRCSRSLPKCGDGARNGDEQCEGSDLGNETCGTQGFEGGALACKSDCTFDTSGCYKCGDGVINGPTEVCDGASLGIHSCKTQGFYDGQLKCNPDCTTFDTSECHDCGNGLINSGEQCDGVNFGGKTCQTEGFGGGTLTCENLCSAISVSSCTTTGFVTLPPSGTLLPVTFTMGSPTSEPCRTPYETPHQVTLTHGFELSVYEVTQGEFQAQMGYNPAYLPACGADCPVEMVSWHEAAAYCNALSQLKVLSKCYTCSGSGSSVTCQEATPYSGANIYDCPGYRLPTEAEWEYAYRSGSNTPFYPSVGNDGTITNCTSADPNADKIGWYFFNSNNTTHPIGIKSANTWGLYDMAGNVYEWCHDWYQTDLGSSAVTDPWGQASGSDRAVRGGSWSMNPRLLRAAHRSSAPATSQSYSKGIRPCRTMQ